MVEGTGLENRQAGDRLVGSNPTPSAKTIKLKGFSQIFQIRPIFHICESDWAVHAGQLAEKCPAQRRADLGNALLAQGRQ